MTDPLPAIAKLGEYIGFTASCIRSGEPWTATCEQLRDEARAALATLREIAAGDHIAGAGKVIWRPIVEAPRDGTWILAWLGGVADCADTIQWAYGGWWNGCSGHVRSGAKPTHWMPLPDAPGMATAALGDRSVGNDKVIVPREPTQAMLTAFGDAMQKVPQDLGYGQETAVWTAMVDAALGEGVGR